jgi:hypothetical protein
VLGVVVFAVGTSMCGLGVVQAVSPGHTMAAVTLPARTVHQTRVLTKKVRGRVVTLRGGERVVRVPRTVLINRGCYLTREYRCVRRVIVPAHVIRLRATSPIAAIATAIPEPTIVYVTVTIPGPTTPLPAVTVTDLQTTTATVTVTSPPQS